jgi:hypothetical protein
MCFQARPSAHPGVKAADAGSPPQLRPAAPRPLLSRQPSRTKSRFPAQRPHAHKSRLVGKAAGDRHIWTRRYALAVRPGAAGGDGVIGRCGGDDCVAGPARKLLADVPDNLEPGRRRYRSVPASRPTRDMQAGIGRDRGAAKLKRSKSSLSAPPSASPGGPPFPSRLALSTMLTLIAESPEPR